MRLITFNIAHGCGPVLHQGISPQKIILSWLDKIAEMFTHLDADIIALQEVDEDSRWNGHLDLLEYLREKAGYKYKAYGMHHRNSGRYPLQYGNGFLSKYPLTNSDTQSFGDKKIGTKGFLYSQCDTPSGKLDLINLHLDFKSRKNRINQCRQIKQYILDKEQHSESNTPIAPIVFGDFNASIQKTNDATRWLYDELSAHTHYRASPISAKTFPSYLPQKSIDYIFVPKQFHVSHSEVVRRKISDHCPVLVEISDA